MTEETRKLFDVAIEAAEANNESYIAIIPTQLGGWKFTYSETPGFDGWKEACYVFGEIFANMVFSKCDDIQEEETE